MSAQSASVDFYAALDIPRTATTQEINAAYKRLALKYHPDKCGERFLEKFREITEAAECLRDTKRRTDHDRALGHVPRGLNNNRRQPRRYNREDDWRNWSSEKRPWRNNEFNYNLKNPRDCYMYSYGSSVHMDPNSAESMAESDRISAEAERWAAEYAAMQAEYEAESAAQSAAEAKAENEAFEQANFERWPKSAKDHVSETNQAAEPAREAEHVAFKEVDEFDTWSNDGQASNQPEFETWTKGAQEKGSKTKQATETDRTAKWKMPGQYFSSQFDSIYHSTPDLSSRPDINGLFGSVIGSEIPGQYPSGQSCTSTHYSGDKSRSCQTSSPQAVCKTSPDEYYNCNEHFGTGPSVNCKSSAKKTSRADRANVQELVTAEGPLGPFCPYFNAKLADGSERFSLDDMAMEVNGIIGQIMFEWILVLKQQSGVMEPLIDFEDDGNCSHQCEWTKEFGLPECTICHFWKPIYMMTCAKCGIKRCICCRF
ncbi:unnamed protein product [Penicillium pancosmium]